MRKIILALFLMLFANYALADVTGNDLYEGYKGMEQVQNRNATTAEALNSGMFMGFVIGSSEYMQVAKTLCIPSETLNSQRFDLVYNYLKEHPEKRTDSGLLIVYNALIKVYACR